MRQNLLLLASLSVFCSQAPDAASQSPLSPKPKNNSSIYFPSPPSQKIRPAAPILLGVGPHLFLDEFLIESSVNVQRVVNSPLRDPALPNPIVTGKEDGNFQPYLTVLRDAATWRFRIWYGARTEDSNPMESRLAYMESDDGIHWIRPHRILATPFLRFGVSIIEDGANFSNTAARYKLGWYAAGGSPGLPGGFAAAISEFGLSLVATIKPVAQQSLVMLKSVRLSNSAIRRGTFGA